MNTLDDKIVNAFFSEFNRLIEENSGSLNSLKNQNSQWGKKYLHEVIVSIGELTEFQREVELILSGYEPKPIGGFLLKTVFIDELILTIKMYLIAWSTIKDLTARLISTVFDLGIYESDVSFGVVTRNSKVANSRVNPICKKYQKELKFDGTAQARNSVVHRATIPDEELKALKTKIKKINAKRYSLFEEEKISEENFKKQRREYDEELKTVIECKTKYYRNHYEKSITFLTELVICLAGVVFDNLNEKRI